MHKMYKTGVFSVTHFWTCRLSYFSSLQVHCIGKDMNEKSDKVALLRYKNNCHKEELILMCVAPEGKSRASGYTKEKGRQ